MSDKRSNEISIPTIEGERKYLLHAPEMLETKPSLVIALHPYGSNMKLMEHMTKLSEKSEQERFLVAYPEGTSSPLRRKPSWNAGFCCGAAYEDKIDDVSFIRQVIEDIDQEYGLDFNRIFVTGFSNGALLAHRLGAELSDIIAAIAPISGAAGGKATTNSMTYMHPIPSDPISVLMIHGTADDLIPYDGGRIMNNDRKFIEFISVRESLEFWARSNG